MIHEINLNLPFYSQMKDLSTYKVHQKRLARMAKNYYHT